MERVSFKVAKVLKKAGYPQDELDNPDSHWFYDEESKCDILRMTYIEVWLWLWEEKKIHIEIIKSSVNPQCYATINNEKDTVLFNSPEGAIITAIDYLVENDLIK